MQVRRLALLLVCFAACALCAAHPLFGQTLTFTGQVYSPLGPPVAGSSAVHGDPIPNILVFIQDPNSPLPVFSEGLTLPSSNQTGCQAQPSLVPSTVLGSAITDPTGSFNFNVAGTLPSTVNVVIQAGKWRRQYAYTAAQIASFTTGTQVVLPTMSMPANQSQGDLPHIAVVTGSADQIECIFPQIGISTSEVTDPTGSGSINFFSGNGSSGNIVSSSTPTETQLVNPNATGAVPLTNYDMVIFGCQGPSGRTDADATLYANNVVNYADTGGRMFGTHWEFSWIQHASAWSGLASWSTNTSTNSVTTPGQLSTSYSGEPVLAAWMNYTNSFDINPAKLEFTLTNVFYENVLAVNPPAQTWVTLPNYSDSPNQFSFDTPLGASGTPTAVVNFTNTQSNFLRGDPSDTIVINVTDNSNTATLPGLTLTISIPNTITPLSLADSSGGAWNCTLSTPTATCTLPTALAAGASDAVTLTFSIPKTSTLGISTLTAALSNGGLNQSQQCGRVLYNDYHVESSVSSKSLWNNGAHCTQNTKGLTNAQKFLEYSLYNLSSFVAPANSDTLQIQESGVITWAPASPQFYGVALSDLENATVNTPGTTTYTVSPSTAAVPDLNTYTITASFVPYDTVDYLSTSAKATVQIVPDATVSTITSLEQNIFYGQEIGYDPSANPTDANLSTDFGAQSYTPWIGTTVPQGSFTVTIDGKVVCTGTQQGGPVGGTRPGACPDSTFMGWDAGVHTMQLVYAGTNDFSASSSPAYPVQINPDPTAVALSSSNLSPVRGANVTYTATVSDAYTTATGSVVFYAVPASTAAAVASGPNSIPVAANATVIGSVPVTSPTATLTLPAFTAGTMNVVACFVANINASGTFNFLDSCSASVAEVVTDPISNPSLSATLVASSSNPSLLGQAVTFTATVGSTGAVTIVPTGTVTFYDGATALGTATLANGQAVYTTSTLALGTHPITVRYAGNTQLAASTSGVLNQLVNSPLTAAQPGFLLIVNPTTVPVYVGSSAVVSVQIVPLTNFTNAVQLSCTGLPAQASCTFAQTTVPSGGGTTQLLVSSGAPHDCNNSNPYFATLGGRGLLSLAALCGLTACFGRRRRKLQGIALAALLVVLPNMLTGCGGSCTDFAVKPGDYSFTVTATPQGTVSGSSAYTGTQTQPMTMHVHL